MISKEELKIISKYEEEILDVIHNRDDYTTSDLQGRIEAIVLNILREGKKLKGQ